MHTSQSIFFTTFVKKKTRENLQSIFHHKLGFVSQMNTRTLENAPPVSHNRRQEKLSCKELCHLCSTAENKRRRDEQKINTAVEISVFHTTPPKDQLSAGETLYNSGKTKQCFMARAHMKGKQNISGRTHRNSEIQHRRGKNQAVEICGECISPQQNQ